MRLNLPTSQQEVTFPKGQTLVSITDTKGRIVHCNPAFIAVSGFTRTELLGQPHNLIRHPDMPSEAFRDMWQTIQAGQPWTGLVKNRCKDGSFYWVRANVTPMREDSNVTGYLSVRTEAEPGEIEATSALYARLNTQEPSARKTLGLSRGLPVHTTALGSGTRAVQGFVRRCGGWVGLTALWLGLGAAAALAMLATLGRGGCGVFAAGFRTGRTEPQASTQGLAGIHRTCGAPGQRRSGAFTCKHPDW
jgi:aerotaxis receptor